MPETPASPRAPASPLSRPPAQVFISNANADRHIARRIADLIEAQGYVVWWERNLGAPDSGAAYAAATAPCLVAIWSRASLSSRWVLEEAEAAATRGALLEVMIDPIVSPLEKPTREPVSLAHWSGEADDSPAWKTLMARVRSLAGGPQGRPVSRVPLMVASGVGVAVAAVLTAVVTAPAPQMQEAAAPEPLAKIEPAPRGAGGPAARLASEPESALPTFQEPVFTPLLTPSEPLAEEPPPEPVRRRAAPPPAAPAPAAPNEGLVLTSAPEPSREQLGPMP